MRESYSLRAHLIAFATVTLLPVTVLAAVLLARAGAFERAQLEARLVEVADNIADALDRDVDRQITILRTLAMLPALATGDWATFYVAAKAAVGSKAYVILIDTSYRQVVNTFVPYGEAPPTTGDPETVRRMLESKEPVVSNLFVSLVTKKPVYNVSIPITLNGSNVRYVLSLGALTDDLLPFLQGQGLGSEWVTAIIDRQGLILARSKNHERLSGKPHAGFASDAKASKSQVRRTVSLEGDDVFRAAVRSKVTGWLVTASIPATMAEAPLRRSLWLWGALSSMALLVAILCACLFSRLLARPMIAATKAAAALGHEQPIVPLRSFLTEANAIVAAQERASGELMKRAEQQRLLLHELSHRVKNILAVVQSLVTRTLSEGRSISDARDVLSERLRALGRAHEMLMRTDWKGTLLQDIVEAELAPFSARVAVQGPRIVVDSGMVQTFALLLHELATNAAKYGSLSAENGTVSIEWLVTGVGREKRFKFRWEEKGGPPVKPPFRNGFGTALLEAAIPSNLNVKPRLSFEPGGFVYEIDAPLTAVGAMV
jgi:two-component sensor histidine kinase